MLLQVILEGLGLGALLALVCAVGIRKGAVGMVHLYSPAVQQRCVKLGLTTHEKIKRNSQLFKAVCIPGYIGYVLVCVYGINGAKGFAAGFWQLLVILSVMNLIDRFLIDGYWVGHTNAWTIPGTEDLKPYITAKDKQKKWLFGTVGMAGIAAVREAGTYNTRENQAQFSTFQSRLRPRLYQLCAGLCLWDKRCAQLCGGFLAAAGDFIHDESHGPLFDRWLLGGAHERMDDSRNRGPEALHYCKRQAEKVAVRHGGDGGHSDGAGGNDDSTVIGKPLLSAAFSASSQGSGTTG